MSRAHVGATHRDSGDTVSVTSQLTWDVHVSHRRVTVHISTFSINEVNYRNHTAFYSPFAHIRGLNNLGSVVIAYGTYVNVCISQIQVIDWLASMLYLGLRVTYHTYRAWYTDWYLIFLDIMLIRDCNNYRLIEIDVCRNFCSQACSPISPASLHTHLRWAG